MLIYDEESENLIKRIGHDAPLTFIENYTNVEFVSTIYEMTVANEQINRELGINYYVTLETFLANFNIPISILSAIPKTDLECGFSYNCHQNFDVEWIDFYITCDDDSDDLKFIINYWETPCYGCNKCDGDGSDCDRYLSGDMVF